MMRVRALNTIATRAIHALLLAGGLAFCMGMPLAAPAQTYSVNQISTAGLIDIYPSALNDAGQFTGTALFANFANGRRAFLWTPTTPNGTTGSFRNLGTYKSYNPSYGQCLNSAGTVAGAGNANGMPHALLWPAGGAAQLIGPSRATFQTEGRGINNVGQVAVWQPAAGVSSTTAVSMVVGGNRSLFAIGEGLPIAINAGGQVLATASGTTSVSYIWTPTTPNGSTGTKTYIAGADVGGMNDLGQAGCARTFDRPQGGGTYTTPALYLPTPAYGMPAGLNDLAFPAAPPPAGQWYTGTTWPINNSGVAVGRVDAYDLTNPANPVHTYSTLHIWDSVSGMRDLNDLIVGTGWRLRGLYGFNNVGQILGVASYLGGPDVTVLLNPM